LLPGLLLLLRLRIAWCSLLRCPSTVEFGQLTCVARLLALVCLHLALTLLLLLLWVRCSL
jgi:hypothetical protein